MLDLGALKLSVVVDSKDANQQLDNFSDKTENTENKLKGFASTTGKMAVAGIAAMTTF